MICATGHGLRASRRYRGSLAYRLGWGRAGRTCGRFSEVRSGRRVLRSVRSSGWRVLARPMHGVGRRRVLWRGGDDGGSCRQRRPGCAGPAAATADSFVGRESELAQARYLLGHNRLLTLTGPGGCGKTRLSIALVASVMGAFPGGVRFVPLAASVMRRWWRSRSPRAWGCRTHGGTSAGAPERLPGRSQTLAGAGQLRARARGG
jgi:hypothetical protein